MNLYESINNNLKESVPTQEEFDRERAYEKAGDLVELYQKENTIDSDKWNKTNDDQERDTMVRESLMVFIRNHADEFKMKFMTEEFEKALVEFNYHREAEFVWDILDNMGLAECDKVEESEELKEDGYRGLSVDKFYDTMFEKYVPDSGKCDNVGGEIIRAVTRINYRNYNDGDHIGVGYGNETCNSAARYLIKYVPGCEDIMNDLWGESSDNIYDAALRYLLEHIKQYLEEHPELFEMKNTDDMFNYAEIEDSEYDDEDDVY